MDKQAEEFEVFNFTLAGILYARGLAGLFMKNHWFMTNPGVMVLGSLGTLYAGSGVMINRGQTKTGHATGTATSVALMGAGLVKSGHKLGYIRPKIFLVGALATFFNGSRYLGYQI